MSHPSIYTTFLCESLRYKELLPKVIQYIGHNPEAVCRPDMVEMILSTKPSFHDIIPDLYERLNMEGLIRLWTFVRPDGRNDVGIPQIFNLPQVPIDMAQAVDVIPPQDVSLLGSIPFLNDKMVINVIPFTRTDGRLVNTTDFHAAIVRDALSRSYYNTDRNVWISMGFLLYLTKIYTMIFGGYIAETRRLDIKNTMLIKYIFGLFFLTQVIGPHQAQDVLKAQFRALVLPEPPEQEQLLGMMRNQSPTFEATGLATIADVIKAVNDGLAIPRVTIDRLSLTKQMTGALDPNIVYTNLAFGYPPIFAYLVLRALSGFKSGLYKRMQLLKLMKPEDKELVHTELVKSPNFVHSLQI